MDTAISLKNGKSYTASSLTDSEVRRLQLVCPMCKEKVVKRIRSIPSVTHYFAHHPGKADASCELYHSYAGLDGFDTFSTSQIRGLTYKEFIRSINNDIECFIRLIGLLPLDSPMNELSKLERIAKSYMFDEERESLKILSNQVLFLELECSGADSRLSREIAVIFSQYFARKSARFIDFTILMWLLFLSEPSRVAVKNIHIKSVYSPRAETRADWFISDTEVFDQFSALFIVGASKIKAKASSLVLMKLRQKLEYLLSDIYMIGLNVYERSKHSPLLVRSTKPSVPVGTEGKVLQSSKNSIRSIKWKFDSSSIYREGIQIPLSSLKFIEKLPQGFEVSDTNFPHIIWIGRYDFEDDIELCELFKSFQG